MSVIEDCLHLIEMFLQFLKVLLVLVLFKLRYELKKTVELLLCVFLHSNKFNLERLEVLVVGLRLLVLCGTKVNGVELQVFKQVKLVQVAFTLLVKKHHLVFELVDLTFLLVHYKV